MLNVALSPSFELNVFFSFSHSLSGTTQIKESSAFKCKECCPLWSNQFDYTHGQVTSKVSFLHGEQ